MNENKDKKKLNIYSIVEELDSVNLLIDTDKKMEETINKITAHTRKLKTNIIYGYPICILADLSGRYFSIPVYRKITNPYPLKDIDDFTTQMTRDEFIEYYNDKYGKKIDSSNNIYIVHKEGKDWNNKKDGKERLFLSYGSVKPVLFSEYRDLMDYDYLMKEVIPKISADFDFARALLKMANSMNDTSKATGMTIGELRRGIAIARDNNNPYYLPNDVRGFLGRWFTDNRTLKNKEINHRKYRDFVVWFTEYMGNTFNKSSEFENNDIRGR